MDEKEFMQSAVGTSVKSFHRYMSDLGSIMNQTDVGRWAVIGSVNFINEKIFQKKPFDRSRHDAFTHGLYLIGAWGAFEAFFDDFFVAALESDPDALDQEFMTELKVKYSDKTDASGIYRALSNKVDRDPGTKRFEQLLKAINLNGDVPEEISIAVSEAQQIRHLWAHRAGISDERFIKKAESLDFEVGTQVGIDNKEARTYVVAIFLYGSIVFNRWRVKLGLDPITPKTSDNHPLMKAYQRSYPEHQPVYPTATSRGWHVETPEETAQANQPQMWTTKDPSQPSTEDSASDTSPSESDAPPESPAPPNAEEPQVQTSSTDSGPVPSS